MPLYLVRWPSLRASIIRANDEEQLKDTIDELADPGSCTWSVYRGPLWVDFSVPVEMEMKSLADERPMTADDIHLKGVEELAESFRLNLTGPETETKLEMEDAVTKRAFPATAAAVDGANDEGKIDPDALAASLREDLVPLLQYEWRLRNESRAEGPEADLRRRFGVTINPTWLMPDKEQKDE